MRPTVLVRDEESSSAAQLAEVLGEDGYDVLIAPRDAEYRRIIGEREIDAIILDLNLSDGNGFSLMREVRRQSDVAIVVLTRRRDETDHVVALEMGADDYVIKPFRERELRARINAVLRRTRGTRLVPSGTAQALNGSTVRDAAEIQFDGYILNTSRRQLLRRGGQEIDLTMSEFDLLHALVAQRGKVLTRDKIMTAIRGRDWECYDRAVDSMVSRLRKKIPAPEGHSHYIRTVYGVGYTFRG